MNINELGQELRRKYPNLHNQPDFYNGKLIYGLKSKSIKFIKGIVYPEYELHEKEFQASSRFIERQVEE